MFADRECNPGATDLDADRLHERRDAMIDMIDHSQDHAKPHQAQMPPNSQFVARGFRKRSYAHFISTDIIDTGPLRLPFPINQAEVIAMKANKHSSRKGQQISAMWRVK